MRVGNPKSESGWGGDVHRLSTDVGSRIGFTTGLR